MSPLQRFWAQPLQRQLLVADLLLLLPVLGLATWSGFSALREHREELVSQAQVVATTTAAYLDRDIQNFDRMAQQLTDDPAVLDPARIPDLLTRAVVGRSSLLSIAVVEASGKDVGRVGVAPDQPADRTWLAATVRSRRRVVEPMRATSTGAAYVVFGYPVERAGAVKAVLAVYIQPASLHHALASLQLPPSSVVAVADADGQILTQSVDVDRVAGQKLYGGSRQIGDVSAFRTYTASDEIERVYVERTAAAGPWLVSVGLPSSIIYDRTRSSWMRGAIIVIVGLAGCFMVTWLLARRLRESVGHLSNTASRIAAGDFGPMQTRPMLSAEFEQLQGGFARMLEQFNRTKNALDGQMTEERRIRQELESLQGQVIRQERLAAVGQLVSGVAHEINNPLQAILGFSELLQMQADVSETVKGDLRLIQKESARACGIIRNLALFARQQPGESGAVLIGDVIRAVAELRQRRLESEDIELQLEDRATRPVTAVMTELQQVVLNFVVNAEQSVVASGRLPGRITIRSYDRDGRVVLEVEDTGPGVAPENEAKLFQPFFTTKPVGQGTGLGLSISYGIVDSLGGGIGYRRAPAGGSIFFFDLPARAVD